MAFELKNGFIPSNNIKVFPCAYRGYTENTNTVFDPEARLNTEYNLTHTSTCFKENYIIKYGLENNKNTLEVVIAGYYFKIIDLNVNDFKGKYLCINLKDPTAATGEYNYNNTVLSSVDENANQNLDILLPEITDPYYFVGLKVFEDATTGTHRIKVFNSDSTLCYNEFLPNISSGTGVTQITNGEVVTAINTYSNTASGEKSFAIGSNTKAAELNSFSSGFNTEASGEASHAEGFYTKATGNYGAHAEGSGFVNPTTGATIYTEASGNASHAEGFGTTASGNFGSHAEGAHCEAANNSAHAEGDTSVASGIASHASGWHTTASGNQAYSEGYFTTAYGNGSHAEGYGEYIKLTVDQINNDTLIISFGNYSIYKSNILGHMEENIFKYYHVETSTGGSGKYTIALDSTPLKQDTDNWYLIVGIASKEYAHVEGYKSTASGAVSHAEGSHVIASGHTSHAEGENTKASGSYSHAEGYITQAVGLYSHAEGAYTIAEHNGAHTAGYYTKSSASYQTVIGKYNANTMTTSKTPLFIVGNGTSESESDRKNAFEVYENSGRKGLIAGFYGTNSDNNTLSVYIGNNTNGGEKRYGLSIEGGSDSNLYVNKDIDIAIGSINFLSTNATLTNTTSNSSLSITSNGVKLTSNADTGLVLNNTSSGQSCRLYMNGTTLWIQMPTDYTTEHNTFDFTNDGQVVAKSFNATSDKRLKENIISYTSEKSILDLPIYKYDFINGQKNQIGCLAQDLQEICPEIVSEGSNGYLNIQESKIVYLLLDEVKKLKKEVKKIRHG